jgi:hypothetical protein
MATKTEARLTPHIDQAARRVYAPIGNSVQLSDPVCMSPGIFVGRGFSHDKKAAIQIGFSR